MYCDGFPATGRRAYVYRTEEFVRRGHDTVVITTGGRAEVDTDLEIHYTPRLSTGIDSVDAYLNAAIYLVYGLVLGAYLYRRRDFDIVRACMADTPGLTAAVLSRLTGLPFVLSVHGRGMMRLSGTDADTEWGDRFLVDPGVKFRVLNWVYDEADRILAVSDFITDYIPTPEKAVTLPPPVDTDRYRSDGEKEDVILTVAYLYPMKNLRAAIEGFLRADTDMEYWIVGDGPLREELEAEYASDRVNFLGFLGADEVADVFSQAKIFLLPSLRETFGKVYLEALASGCPVIASDRRSGAPEIISDGEEGRLVDPEDLDAIATAIEDVASDRERMVENAVQRSRDYSVDGVTTRMITEYREIISRTG